MGNCSHLNGSNISDHSYEEVKIALFTRALVEYPRNSKNRCSCMFS